MKTPTTLISAVPLAAAIAGSTSDRPVGDRATRRWRRRCRITTQMHGQTLTDEYFWLREKTNPERSWTI